jgi:hypothetical protein
MSKLMEQRKAAQTKKSTILLSVETAQDAVNIGKSVINALQAEGKNDPQLEQAVEHLDTLLHSQPDQMQSEGAMSVEDYFDDAVLPEVARQAKNEVDMIAQKRREQRPAQVTKQPAAVPAAQPAMASDEKTSAAGNDAYTTDRDESGNPKAPEKAEVPRLAAKKKEAQPEPPVAAPPAAAPAAPAAGGGSLDALFAKLPSDFVADLVKKLTSLEGFEQDKDVQAAVENLAGILQTRPVEAAPAPGAPAAAPTASAKKGGDFGGKQAPPFGKKDNKEKKDDKKKAFFGGLRIAAAEKVAVAPPGREDQVKALKKEDVDNPYAVAWDSYNKSHGASATVKEAFEAGAKALAAHIAKTAAAGFFSWDQSTGDVTESGGRTPEVAEAHSKIDEAPAHLERPDTTLPIKLAGEMTAQKAVKEAERLGRELKETYLAAKDICTANDSRPVREFVESIFRAGAMADEAVKTLNKQVMQEESEEAAAKVREKSNKKSSLGGLVLAASAE